MSNIIACNLSSYHNFKETAYAHLARIGLTNIEIPCPEPRDVDATRAELERHGLRATSLMIRCEMGADDVVFRFTRALDVVAEMDVPLVFTSVHSSEIGRDFVYGRLQDIGDAAAERNIVVVLETHPDLATNANVALRTMEGVNHRNIQINFDTANLYYYNRNIEAVQELEKIIDDVAGVHLKDTDGGYQSWHFPALGEGIVDFPSIFQMLGVRGFEGPYTLELEGIRGEEITREGVEQRIEKSLTYLRSEGLIG